MNQSYSNNFNTETHLSFFRSLRGKLILLFLTISLIPLITMGVLAYSQAQNALKAEVINKLVAVRDIKAKQITKYFERCLDDVKAFSNNPFTITAMNDFEKAIHTDMDLHKDSEDEAMNHYRPLYIGKPDLTNADDGSTYSIIHAKYHHVFKTYQEIYGYYDIFLVDPHVGNIIYSIVKEDDFGRSLVKGPYALTNIGHVYQKLLAATDGNFTILEDFAHYKPSYEVASFVASPIFDGSQLAGVLILQLSIAQIDTIMQENVGLGTTGETILVSSDDFLLRSNSRLFKDSTLFKQKVYNEATRASAAGEIGVKEIVDYRGKPTFVAYTPVNISGVHWSLNAKIDKSEGTKAAQQILNWMLIVMGIGIIILLIVNIFFSHSISKPVQIMTDIAIKLANGNMNLTFDIKQRRDEIGIMANAFQQLNINLWQMMEDVVRISQGLASGNLHVMPETEYKGDFILVKNALEMTLTNLQQVIENIVKVSRGLAEGNLHVMPDDEYQGEFVKIRDALGSAIAQNIKQNWLKTGQNQLNEQLSGEQETRQLSENIINFITPYVDAQVGAFYLLVENQDSPPYLKMMASHAYMWRKNLANEFKLGEGIVGQAAFERKTIIITQPPADYIYIQSGLGESDPQTILVIPFLYENTLKGVIELASFKVFTDVQIEFMQQVMPIVAVAVNSANSRTKLQELLQQTRMQSEELQCQTIQLQTKQEELQHTNEELQSQSEELQTQQEELRQTNEQLGVRTNDLEQQKQAIREQNQALEKNQAEMKVAQATLEKKAKELELASKYKSEFLANMSHELRTPLNSLLILAQLLAENKDSNLTDKQIEYARTIHSAGSDLLTLINEILDLSKVEAGKIEVNIEEVSLTDLVATVEQKFCHIAEKKGLAFHITVADNLPAVLHTDVQRLNQIINNLLSNAFKFTSLGEVRVLVQRPSNFDEIANDKLKLEQTIVISVSDTGIGIPQKKQKVIFEAFQQVDGTTSRRYGGTGLGLSISRQLAQLLGGDLKLLSVEGKGSTFTLYLPETVAVKVSTPTNPTEPPTLVMPLGDESKIKHLGSDLGIENLNNKLGINSLAGKEDRIADDRMNLSKENKSILIIEDDRDFSRLLMELAQEKNFKCIVAEDGKTGLEFALEYQPRAIILDIGLPQINGWTVMEKLKDNPNTRHIPVHFISATNQSSTAKKMGAIGYLHKPVNKEQLENVLEKIDIFISDSVKNVLVIADNKSHQQQILELVGGENIQTTLAVTTEATLQHLQTTVFDCIVLDLNIEQGSGIKLLEQIQKKLESLSHSPVIIYTVRALTSSEEAFLQQCADNFTFKLVSSPERLLDEATLFLHQAEINLPIQKRNMLRMVHDKTAILRHKKVLIVDDDMRNTFALATILEDNDMEVVVAENGKEALTLLNKHSDIAIILMDIMMPEMDGYETLQTIRKQPHYHQLPIIALTAKAMKGDKIKCINAGANDYLAKPVEPYQLISLMRVWLYR